MSKPDEFDPRLKAYLHRGASTPPPAGMEERIVGSASRRRAGWVLQVTAAAALLGLAIGLGIAVQHARRSVGVGPTPTPMVSPTTTPIPSPTPGVQSSAYPLLPPVSFRMFDASKGWAAGEDTNRVLRTVDGGRHWNDVTPRGARPGTWIIYFLDASNAWIASSGQPGSGSADYSVEIYRTADGGSSWQRAGTAMADQGWPAVLDFVDSHHGWLFMRLGGAAGSEGVAFYGTVDGGATWSKLSQTDASGGQGQLPLGCLKVAPVFLDASTGWEPGACNAGDGPFFYVTHDGGRTWTKVVIQLPAGHTACMCTVNALRFSDSRNGDFVLNINQGMNVPQNVLYTTRDAGASWQAGPVLPDNSFTYYFLDPSHGWTLNAKTNGLFFTSDGGRHWSTVGTIPGTHVVMDLQFVTAKIGWALSPVDAGEAILRTDDGGLTWTTQLKP
jgi:photosystem II stability/assembly factor-like uncharacterized protein